MLIFCSSRKGCETTAKHIAKFLKRFSVSPRSDQSGIFDVSSAIDSLQRSPAGLDPILEETIPFGVAYHHAGLTVCLAVFYCFMFVSAVFKLQLILDVVMVIIYLL